MTQNLHFSFTCTKHNFRYAFDRPPLPIAVAHLTCPICVRKELEEAYDKLNEARAHRDLLLKCIDLKQLIQPTKED